MKTKSIKRFLPIVFFVLLIVLIGCGESDVSATNPSNMREDAVYTSEELELKELLESNLYYASQKDIEGYLSTISKRGHEETREAMTSFFEQFHVTHTLIEFEVVEQQADERVAKTRQKSEAMNDDSEDEYKDHIVEAMHVFIKEEDEWKIDETSILDVRFIE